jgi:myo-inositol 2-dehydrogenase / D-chiro-inositol 1-dehydrogenase
MKSTTKNSRRRFLRNSVAILGGISIIPRQVMGRGFLAPSDQLTKGIIGVGGMGRGHIPYAGTRVVAICDVDKTHLTEVANTIGGRCKNV